MSDAENTPAETFDPARSDKPGENSRDGARKLRDPNEPSAIVGLGSSAGGVAVLQQFFGDMAPDSGLAFVVVMHLSPDHESSLAAILQQRTTMPVLQVNEPVKVKPNHIYVIPPHHQLTIESDTLHLTPPQQAMGRRVTIDLFFRTLAQSYGQRALCVVLSGTDSDGSIGLKHVRAQGGVTIAQDPNEAEHDSMPLTAISTGMVDWVLPVAEMSAKLLEFIQNENRMKLPPEAEDASAGGGESVSDETRAPEDEMALNQVLAHLRGLTGHDFAHYKRATILRRIARRLQVNSIETIPHYLAFLRQHPAEGRALLQDLLIGVTHFFRDQESFAALEANIPQLFAGRQKDDQIRVWVAGCATGEEAYSIAMLLCEHAERLEAPPSVQVFASDIDEQAIQEARDGLYPSTIEADVSKERLRRFFVKDHGRYRVRKNLREKVLFAAHNVLSDAPFSRLDLVSCRNLLIYLNPKAQAQVFDIFHFSLRNGGLLFIGASESSSVHALFAPVDGKHRIYVRRSVPRPAWRLPTLPGRATEPRARRSGLAGARRLPPLGPGAAEEAGTNTEQAVFSGQERRAALFGQLHLKLLEQYAPPSIVVNEDHEIVHLSEKAGRYLRFAAGEPSMNIFRIIAEELQIELRTALFRAAQGEELNIIGAPHPVPLDGGSEQIRLQVRRIESAQGEKFFLILFERTNDAPVPSAPPAAAGDVTRDLDDEIQHLKEQLALNVEHSEASSDELKASNEELQAMNEEMRSATEELETSKEELQSLNEELITVNHELKTSVEDLSNANSDLHNAEASSDIGTLFLDRKLRIQRFTPAAQKIFNLIPADVGRPLSDITHKLQYEGMADDAHRVLDDLTAIEREVSLAGDGWFLLRIAPYRTTEDRIAGVVATFVDITRRKKAEGELRASREETNDQARIFNATLSTITDFAYLFDREGRFVFANQPLLDLWGMKLEEAVGKNFFDLQYEPGLAAKLHKQIEEVFTSGETVRDETPYTSPSGGVGYYEYIFSPLLGPDGTVQSVVGSTHVITEWKKAETALRESEERFRTVADNVPPLIWTNDAQGRANYFNRRMYEYSGLSDEELRGQGWQAFVHSDDAPASGERWQEAIDAGEIFDCEFRLRRADGVYRWFLSRNLPFKDEAGQVTSWFGSATDIQDLKETGEALRVSEERYRLLVESARDYAIFMVDPSNTIMYWNRGAERVFGWTAEEALGQSGELVFTPEDRLREREEKEIAIALRDGSASDRRWHLRKDGGRIWVDGAMHRLEDTETGALRGFAKVARDATDLYLAQEELERRVEERTAAMTRANISLQAEIENRARLEQEILLVSEREKRRIGQDLHDSLCQELAATAFLLESNAQRLAKTSRAQAKAFSEAAQKVNENVGLARDLARGMHPVELTSGGLADALRELAYRASNPKISCHFVGRKTVRVHDEAVALSLYRIAQEALNNALKHGQPTTITITLECVRKKLILRVHDDGDGFGLDESPRGLGIHIMKYRAQSVGGTLEIKSKKSQGTTITCTVPVATCSPPPAKKGE